MRKLGMYIHIPFCKSKCYYCDFCSWAGKESMVAEYIKWLKEEIKDVAKGIKSEDIEISTIYIGGGTPSYIDGKYIAQIMEQVKAGYCVSEDAEITIEVNPGTVDAEKLQAYKQAGINRLSIGLQSTHDAMLKQIGRIHTYEEFLSSYQLARKVGFQNINVDLIIGLPRRNSRRCKRRFRKNNKPISRAYFCVFTYTRRKHKII